MSNKKDRPGIIFRKERGKPVPASAYDAEQWDAIPDGGEVEGRRRSKRSNPQNRLYWQILSNVIAASGSTMPATTLHDRLKKHLGYTFLYTDLDGSLKEDVDSTAFNNMDAQEFRIYFDAAMQALAEMCGFDPMATLTAEAA